VRDEGLGALLHKVGIQISDSKIGETEEGSVFFQLKNCKKTTFKNKHRLILLSMKRFCDLYVYLSIFF
jgi:hypothetical protein